jgi:hypothetical protein
MSRNVVLRTAGTFSLLSVASIFAVAPFAARLRGAGGPGPIEFGDASIVEKLAAAGSAATWVDGLALLGPALAFPIGFGWYQLTKQKGPTAGFSVGLWYIGMIFIVMQDALQLAFVSTLPQAYMAADASTRPALLSVGSALASAIRVISDVGAISYLGAFLTSLLMWSCPGIPRWITAVGVLSGGIAVLSTILPIIAPSLEPLGAGRPIGIIMSMIWIGALGIVMLRKKEAVPAVA